MDIFTEKAFAKVNFGLRIFPERGDGFHNLESLFQTVSLCDELAVSVVQEKGCLVTCDTMELPGENTLTAAYAAFCSAADFPVPGVQVELRKGIPAGGGLGGGSADAAALVRVLEKICGRTVSPGQRDFIASRTGSDVFFFVHCGGDGRGAALVSGRGELVRPVRPRLDLPLAFAFPPVASSTAEAYALVDSCLGEKTFGYPDFSCLEEIYNRPARDWCFKNTFTEPLCKKYPEIGSVLAEVRRSGAAFADMSGSGSTVFGVFESEAAADAAVEKLSQKISCKLARTV